METPSGLGSLMPPVSVMIKPGNAPSAGIEVGRWPLWEECPDVLHLYAGFGSL